MELTFDERMSNLEALIVQASTEAQELAMFDDTDTVVTDVFDAIQDLKQRVTALTNALDIVERTISPR